MAVFTGCVPPSTRSLWIVAGFVTLLALVARLYYVTSAQVYQPVDLPGARGDAVDYYRYAWNISRHGTFSRTLPGTLPLLADSYRDPGYPLLMAGVMKVTRNWETWYGVMLFVQAILGALTTGLLLMSARSLLSLPWLAAAGVLMALWPHSLSASSFLLTEVTFGFLVSFALALTSFALPRPRATIVLAAGTAFSAAALTNAVLLPFAPLLGLVLWRQRKLTTTLTVLFVAASVLGPAIWGLRNELIPVFATSSGRATSNLVQGSWPTYLHDFQRGTNRSPAEQSVVSNVDTESAVFQKSIPEGLKRMADRFAARPWTYASWYLSKPALLWGWDIKVGQGDIYVYSTRHSPFTDDKAGVAVWAICKALNYLLAGLALVTCIASVLHWRSINSMAHVAGLLLLFITLIYTVLQAEPRYSVAFRGEEIVLAMASCAAVWRYTTRLGTRPITDTTVTPKVSV